MGFVAKAFNPGPSDAMLSQQAQRQAQLDAQVRAQERRVREQERETRRAERAMERARLLGTRRGLLAFTEDSGGDGLATTLGGNR